MILQKHPLALLRDLIHMLDRVYKMKKLLVICIVLIMVLLKSLFPANEVLIRQTLSFLGLERSSVQALGRSMVESAP